MKVLISILGLTLISSGLAHSQIPVDQVARWEAANLRPQDSIRLDKAVALYQRLKPRYEAIQAMRPNGVPAPILFCLHYRESDNDFTCHFHEGSPLAHRTRDEPKGRLIHPDPPYTWQQSAEDAYYVCERPPLDKINWSNLQAALDKMESFNGYGYRRHGIDSPYLWSGTNLYSRGKFPSDGRFDPLAVDRQLGCVAILKRMQFRALSLKPP